MGRSNEVKELIKMYNKYYNNCEFSTALNFLFKADDLDPNDFFILTCIGNCYSYLGNYPESLIWTEKAFKLKPTDPFVKFNYAFALHYNRKYEEAINIFNKIIRRGVFNIGFVDCAEGLRWAKGIYMDSIYAIGLTYKDLALGQKALKYMKRHLKLRTRGIPSIWYLNEVKWHIKALEREIKNDIKDD